MASLTTRSENLDVLKTRRLILQNVNGTYPTINTVPTVADSQGTIGFSTMTVDSSGNVTVPGSLSVIGTINTSNPGALINNITITNVKPSISGTYNGTDESYLYLEPLGGRVSIGTLPSSSGGFIAPSHTFEVNGDTLLRNGLVVEDVNGTFTVDGDGNMTLKGNLVVLPGGSITGSIDGSNVTGQTNVVARSITGDISGSQVIGDICGGAFYVSDGGYVNTYLLRGDISGGRIQGDISGRAVSITGTIDGEQVVGNISGSAGSIRAGGAVLGESVNGDIDGGARYIRSDNGYVHANLIVGGTGFDTSDTATWYKGRINGTQIISDLTVSARSITGTINGPTQISNGVPAQLLYGDISSGVTINGSLIIDTSIPSSKLSGSIASAQLPVSIPAGTIYGDLSNGYIRGDHLYNDISASLLRGSMVGATVPAANISYINTGVSQSVFSATMDASGMFTTPIDLPYGCIFSLFARAVDHPNHSIFTIGNIDESRKWTFASTSNSSYTMTPSSDFKNVIITPTPTSPSFPFTLYYSLVSNLVGPPPDNKYFFSND